MLSLGGLEALRVEASFFFIFATRSAFKSSTLRILILGPKNQKSFNSHFDFSILSAILFLI